MKKKPKFLRQTVHSVKRLEKKWKRPRGSTSKLRRHMKAKGLRPLIGYRTPKSNRHMHPSGFKEILIFNENGLERIDPKKEAVKISSSVGKRKRGIIVKKAGELKIKVLNP